MASDVRPSHAHGRRRWSREQWLRRQDERRERDVARTAQQVERHRAQTLERMDSWAPGSDGDACGRPVHETGFERAMRGRRRHPDHRAADIIRAVLLGVFLVVISSHAATGADNGRALDGLAYLLLVAESVSFVWWRRRPWMHWGVALAVSIIWYGVGYANGPVMVPLLLAVAGVASTRSFRAALVAAAAPIVVLVATMLGGGTVSLAVTLIVSGWTFAVLVAGRMSQAMRERRLAWTEWAAAQQREEEATERRQADEERMRIAREVHDVVSHNLAVIRVQASVALHLLDTDKRPEQAREALAAIKQSSADALADLRTTLDVLRNPDDAAGAPRTPGRSVSLADLGGLIANAEAAGLPVELTVRGAVDLLPDDLALAGYRVVQEAITNVLRHAGPARAEVLVDGSTPGRLVVEVSDDGVGAAIGADGEARVNPWGGGHGITGMRERVEVLGGTLEAGPISDGAGGSGGFRVRAVLPVPELAGPGAAGAGSAAGSEPAPDPTDAGASR